MDAAPDPDPDRPPEPREPAKSAAVREAGGTSEPPPDAGEPMGAQDARPAMLAGRFKQTLAAGMAIGFGLALFAHWRFEHVRTSHPVNAWSWLLAGIGGIAVGGAVTLFLYGAATDRSDTGTPKRRGRADVSTEGEDRRSRRRRLRDTARQR
jgi:hypothetical protein